MTLIVGALAACSTPIPSVPQPSASDALLASLEPAARTQLVFRLDRIEAGWWVPHLTLYEDGRFLRWDRVTDALTIQTMSRSGMDAFIADVHATRSFEVSHDLPLVPVPGVEVPGLDPPLDRFTLAVAGAEPIVVVNTPFHDPAFQESAEREVLIALADRVMDTSWLPDDAWVDEATRPFVPDAYVLFTGVTPSPEICPPGSVMEMCKRDVATIQLPFELPPDGIGPPFISADGSQSVVDHCAIVTLSLANTLAAFWLPQFGTPAGHFYLNGSVPWRDQSASYELSIRPLFPEEAATCVGKSLPPTIGP